MTSVTSHLKSGLHKRHITHRLEMKADRKQEEGAETTQMNKGDESKTKKRGSKLHQGKWDRWHQLGCCCGRHSIWLTHFPFYALLLCVIAYVLKGGDTHLELCTGGFWKAWNLLKKSDKLQWTHTPVFNATNIVLNKRTHTHHSVSPELLSRQLCSCLYLCSLPLTAGRRTRGGGGGWKCVEIHHVSFHRQFIFSCDRLNRFQITVQVYRKLNLV